MANIYFSEWTHDLMYEPEQADLQMNYIDDLMNDYWSEMLKYKPLQDPEIVPRVTYDITWPADPWSPVKVDSSNYYKAEY